MHCWIHSYQSSFCRSGYFERATVRFLALLTSFFPVFAAFCFLTTTFTLKLLTLPANTGYRASAAQSSRMKAEAEGVTVEDMIKF